MQLAIKDFPLFHIIEYKHGHSYSTDSKVFDFEFEKEGHDYDIKARVSIDYIWFYRPSTFEDPAERDLDVADIVVEVIKGVMYKGDDEHVLGEKELRRIEKYLIENIKII
jgi:hypothetical protein